jgi:hypothetical protein
VTRGAGAAAGLLAARTLGPLFAVELAGPRRPGSGWRSVAELVERPERLRERVEAVRLQLALDATGGLSSVEERTAASLTAMGLAARLVAPTMGAAALTGFLPLGGPPEWFVGPAAPGPAAVLARPTAAIPCAGDGQLAAALVRHCLEPVVEPLVAAVGGLFSVSAQVLRGNLASAVAGAARACMRARPERAARLGTEMALLFAGPLSDAGTWVRPEPRQDRWFLVRRSCCLLSRSAGAGLCGDCVLLAPAAREAAWSAELEAAGPTAVDRW